MSGRLPAVGLEAGEAMACLVSIESGWVNGLWSGTSVR